MVWCLGFNYFCFSSPKTHPRISNAEKQFLLQSCQEIGRDRKSMKTPWWKMLTSIPVHALWVTHLCHAWGYYLLAVNLPLFGKDVLKLDIVLNGLLSSLPYVGKLKMDFRQTKITIHFNPCLEEATTLFKQWGLQGSILRISDSNFETSFGRSYTPNQKLILKRSEMILLIRGRSHIRSLGQL